MDWHKLEIAPQGVVVDPFVSIAAVSHHRGRYVYALVIYLR